MTNAPLPTDDREERVDAAIAAYLEAADAGRPLRRDEFLAAYPDIADELELFLADNEQVGRMTRPLRAPAASVDLLETADYHAEPQPGEWSRPSRVGPYQLGRLLGEGGMARVYEGVDAGGRRVAVKLIAPQFAASPTTLERFRQEGRLASRINHPRCVFVLAADHEAGQPYIVMELMPGPTLKEYVERRGPLEPGEAVAKILDVIDGLEQAHHLGMIHRDVKPGNCYLDADGRVKIGDFGLSRSLTSSHELTQSGTFVGTPLFASPEQLRGEKVDARTDVYSVCATLFYLLTGQPPFGRVSGPALVARVVSEPPPSPRALRGDVPPGLEQVVLRGLDRNKDRRQQSLEELRRELAAILPTALPPAGLGFRLGAYALDSVLLYVLSQVYLVATLGSAHEITPLAYVAMETAGMLYFWLTEGWWGCTLGKRLVQLRVVDAKRHTQAGLFRIFVRSLVFSLTTGAPAIVFLLAYVDRNDWAAWLGGSWLAVGLGLGLRFSTMRRWNGFRCLHDVLSGTRVVQLPDGPSSAGLLTLDAQRLPPLAASPPSIPSRLGGFLVRGTLATGAEETLLLAEDAALHRPVWLSLRPIARPPADRARCELARPGRLRWLASGEHDGLRWDAYVAPSGMPLNRLLLGTRSVTWSVLLRLLEGVTDELLAASTTATPPDRLGIEQVWVRADGQPVLVDVWPTPEPSRAVDGLAFVQEIARMVAAREAEHGPRTLSFVAPLHARVILERLLEMRPGYRDLAELRRDLDDARRRATAVGPRLRLIQMGILAASLGFVLFMVAMTSRLAAVHLADVAEAKAEHALQLANALSDEQRRERALAALPTERRHDVGLDWERHAERLRILHARWSGLADEQRRRLGFVEAMLLQQYRRQTASPGRGADRDADQEEASGLSARLHQDAPQLLDDASHGFTLGMEREARAVFQTSIVILAIAPALLIVWAMVWPGGVSFWLADLALVDQRGAPCGRWRSGWRGIVVWAPVVALLAFITAVDCFRPEWSWSAYVGQGVLRALLVAFAVLPLRFPERGLHDWLAGTFVVPR